MGLSAVCDCGISWSYSLNSFEVWQSTRSRPNPTAAASKTLPWNCSNPSGHFLQVPGEMVFTIWMAQSKCFAHIQKGRQIQPSKLLAHIHHMHILLNIWTYCCIQCCKNILIQTRSCMISSMVFAQKGPVKLNWPCLLKKSTGTWKKVSRLTLSCLISAKPLIRWIMQTLSSNSTTIYVIPLPPASRTSHPLA